MSPLADFRRYDFGDNSRSNCAPNNSSDARRHWSRRACRQPVLWGGNNYRTHSSDAVFVRLQATLIRVEADSKALYGRAFAFVCGVGESYYVGAGPQSLRVARVDGGRRVCPFPLLPSWTSPACLRVMLSRSVNLSKISSPLE